MKISDRTRFHDLEDRVKIEQFLAGDQKQDNPYARTLLGAVYGVMKQLEWPNELWHLETTLNGKPRHFFRADSNGIGVILVLSVGGKPYRLSFTLHEISKHPTYRFAVEDRRLGEFDLSKGDSLSSLAKAFEDAIVELAAEQSAQPL